MYIYIYTHTHIFIIAILMDVKLYLTVVLICISWWQMMWNFLHMLLVVVHLLSHVQLFATPWTIAHQAPLQFA